MEYRCHNCHKQLEHWEVAHVCVACAESHCHDCTWPAPCCRGKCLPKGERPRFDHEPTEKIDGSRGGYLQGEIEDKFDEPELERLQQYLEEIGDPYSEDGEGEGYEPDPEFDPFPDPDGMEGNEMEDEKSYSAYLVNCVSAQKIKVIKEIRSQTRDENDNPGLSLLEAKNIADRASYDEPQKFLSDMTLGRANHVKNMVELVGGDVMILETGKNPKRQQKRNDEPEDMNPRTFKMAAHFDLQSDELDEVLADMDLTPRMREIIIEDGRFGRHGEVILTCLVDPQTRQIEVIDCDYLS